MHLQRNVKKRAIPKNLKSEILDDIDILSQSIKLEQFNLRYRFFKEFWEAKKNGEIDEFISYFSDQYITKNSNWYVAAPGLPGLGNTNNAIEGFNCAFKKHFSEYTILDIVTLFGFLFYLFV